MRIRICNLSECEKEMKRIILKVVVLLAPVLIVPFILSPYAVYANTINALDCEIGKSTISDCVPDAKLADAISSSLRKRSTDVIQENDIEKMQSLNSRHEGIKDLDGIQVFKNITSVQLSDNSISSIEPLRSLTSLTELNLYGNDISEVSALSSLSRLKILGLGDNNIEDVTPLSSLSSLEELNLSHNRISDASSLGSLKTIKYLWIAGNNLTNAEVVNDFPQLLGADLSENDITNVSRIAVDPSQYLVMTGQVHDLSATIDYGGSVSAEMPIGYDGKHIKPVGISNGGLYDSSTGVVTWKNNEYNGIGLVARYMSQGGGQSGDRPFSGIVRVHVHLNGSTANSDDLQSEQRKASDSTESSSTSASDSQSASSLPDCSSRTEVLSRCFADKRLASLVARELGKSTDDSVAPSELDTITEIDGDNQGISTIEGMQCLHNLRKIFLSGNQITSLTPLTNLSKLYVVSIYNSNITDVSPLANKSELWGLGLGNNHIKDISTITNVPKLAWVDIYSNEINDVSVVSTWPTLNALWISGNPVSDVSPIASVKGLRRLQLESNGIDDMSAFRNLEPSEYSMNDNQLVVRSTEDVKEGATVQVKTVKGRMGYYLAPKNISPVGGVFDSSTGMVTWTGVKKTGNYQFTFSESDSKDYLYAGIVKKQVNVNHSDTTKPTISGVYDTYSTIGEPFDCLYAVKATDDVDGDITNKIVIPKNGVNINSIGTYPIQYYVEDAAQNYQWSGRHVTVTTATLQSIKTYPVYTSVGTAPNLGNIAEATWSDGAKSYEGVIWDSVAKNQYAKVGQFTVKGKVRGKGVSTTVYVSQPRVPISGVSVGGEAVRASGLRMHIGQSTKLEGKYTPSGGAPNSVSWVSANSGIVTVSNTGTVKAVSAGETTIVVTADGHKDSVHVVVAPRLTDVPVDALFSQDIDWLYSVGITQGNSNGTFGYGQILSRQDMAIFLYRMAVIGGDKSASGYKPTSDDYKRFSDVGKSSFGAREILWLASQGVVKGNPDGTFRGADKLSRQDMSVFIHRYCAIEFK